MTSKNAHFSEWPKTWIQRYVSEMLQRLPTGTKLKDLDAEIAHWLIDRHPKRDSKVGSGIQEIRVESLGEWKKGKCMFIYRVDGTKIDFSYRKALAGKEPGKLEYVRMACRTAIEGDIIRFKRDCLTADPVCRYRAIRLWQDNSHVDHVFPKTFNWLVDNFVEKYGLDIEKVDIVGEVKHQFQDTAISRAFLDYHRNMADLELVSAEANQSECKRSKSTSPRRAEEEP